MLWHSCEMGTFICTPHVPIFPLFIHIFISSFQPLIKYPLHTCLLLWALPPFSLAHTCNTWFTPCRYSRQPLAPSPFPPSSSSSIHPKAPSTSKHCTSLWDSVWPEFWSLSSLAFFTYLCRESTERPSLLGQSGTQDDEQADKCVGNPDDLRKSLRARDPPFLKKVFQPLCHWLGWLKWRRCLEIMPRRY